MADDQKKRKNYLLRVDQPYGNQEVIVDTKEDRTGGNCVAAVIGCKLMFSFYLTCSIE